MYAANAIAVLDLTSIQGKTTTTERMLYYSGLINHIGGMSMRKTPIGSKILKNKR